GKPQLAHQPRPRPSSATPRAAPLLAGAVSGRYHERDRPAGLPPSLPVGMNDHALLSAVQRGDRAAFDRLVRDHHTRVYGYLRVRLFERSDVEDLPQEVFIRAYQSQARFDVQTMARPWLIGIARNLLREHIRKAKRRREVAWTELCLELETLPGCGVDRT